MGRPAYNDRAGGLVLVLSWNQRHPRRALRHLAKETAMAGTVLLDVADGVATLTLNRPEALNALSMEMIQDLARAVADLRARKDVAVVVIGGAGEHFMAGGDINDFARQLPLTAPARRAAFRAMIEQYINATVTALQGLHQPVIARVHGACAGFGLSLMLGCDLAVCADDAKFTRSEEHTSELQSPLNLVCRLLL